MRDRIPAVDRTKICWFVHYLIKSNKFAPIEYKFLEVGHTYLDSVRDFALIEKVKTTETIFQPKNTEILRKAHNYKHRFLS